ncbi:GIY-YIG nuclease family protein [Flavobacterium columnare]|uniref:GIY-YIG nuclease family protein n=1 Tax=Flavobacterium columnare TaxID=996 RepID=UPI002D20FA57|nr:GIY-YIG nuclease family protein [Flavobacterium columnare]MEB3801747.1 GIY-YIG nuclease family protein [Flavobacterium columnare]
MDFYIIELQDRLKIGITGNISQRINTIKNASGNNDKDILNLFHFPDSGIFENRLKQLFKPYQSYGEWYFKKGLVEIFINRIKKGEVLSKELINEIQYEIIDLDKDFKNEAVLIYEKIKSERKGLGFPDSVKFETMIRTKKMRYRNMVYNISHNYNDFTRTPNFMLEDIKNGELIECLRIIKNNTESLEEKSRLQGYIDDVFNKDISHISEIKRIIRAFFFNQKKIITQENPDIRIEYDESIDCYSFATHYKDLNTNEYAFLKTAKNIRIKEECIMFNYREGTCFCFFEEEDYPKIINFFKNREIKCNSHYFT